MNSTTPLDTLIIEFDKGLRTVFASARSRRPSPDRDCAEAALPEREKKQAAALMRVNGAQASTGAPADPANSASAVNLLRPTPDNARLAYLMLASLGA